MAVLAVEHARSVFLKWLAEGEVFGNVIYAPAQNHLPGDILDYCSTLYEMADSLVDIATMVDMIAAAYTWGYQQLELRNTGT